jgi:predicted RNase H-like HicB family nuclease
LIQQYIRAAMRRAHYELIEDEEPFYGEIPELAGVWASAETLEECRDGLEQALEDWLVFSLVNGFEIPVLDGLEFPKPVAPSP